MTTLNQDQQAAEDAIFQFLLSSEKEFVITGPAGTGKTFLMGHITNAVLPVYENACQMLGLDPVNYEVVFTATTNKAAEVLQNATGVPCPTIHSFLALKVTDDYDTGISKIIRTPAWTVHKKKLIFIDEASMIDSALYNFLHLGTDNTCKIIYIGDHCQMAPVFEKISPVYVTPKHYVQLNQPVRNVGQPALVDLCNRLRHTVETLEFFPIDPVPGVIDYLDPAQAQSFIDQTFQVENTDSRILCYHNARVQEYNQHIRNLRGYPAQFSVGEHLVNANALQIVDRMLRVEEEFKVAYAGPQPYVINVCGKKGGAELEVYDIQLEDRYGCYINTRIPSSPAHFKELSRYFAKNKSWNEFFWLKNGFPDLRPRDAATVYKAQGSTYDTVFLDLTNIGKCTQTDQLARMLYVGVSRARSRVLLFGQLPQRLFQQTTNNPVGALV